MGIGFLYALELLSLISINLLITFLVIRNFKSLAPTNLNLATPMNTPNSKPSKFCGLSGLLMLTKKYKGDSNLNLSLTVSSIESTLSESSLNDLTPDLISSGSASESSSSSNTTTSPYGSNASGKCFQMSNANFQRDGSSSDSDSPYHITFEDSASLNTPPPIIISPPRQEQMMDGSTPSPSPITERIPGQHQRTSLAERLLSLVDSNGRPIRPVKRSALKDITNIAKPHLSVLVAGDDECNEDALCLVYRSAEEFLPTFVSTPPTCNAPYSDSNGFSGSTSSSRFGDMFSPNASTPTFILPESFKLSNFAGSMTRITGDIVTSLAAKYQNESRYQNEYSDDYEDDDGVVMGQQFEWEDEMRSLESSLGFYGKKV
jgi:hypothetical protein